MAYALIFSYIFSSILLPSQLELSYLIRIYFLRERSYDTAKAYLVFILDKMVVLAPLKYDIYTILAQNFLNFN